MPLKCVDEVDFDFGIGEPRLGEAFGELILERRHVDGPRLAMTPIFAPCSVWRT